ncbi:hemicentin-1 isoform X2 [Nematostella vectensis]|uniref:hemicentin-1 isoform X2 n=1 Tax=Nematostella vectensis TaxID=45351 RepID=UPI00207754CE|nr:hemicentin-1 isoform X2 [Nematostella vectensis]
MGFFFVLCFALDFVISQTAGLITFTRLPPSQVQVFEGTHNLSLTWSFHVVEGENIFTLSFNRGENTIGSHSNDDNKTTIFQSYKTDYSLKVKRLEAVLTINKVKTSLEGEYSIKIVGGFNGTTYQSRGTSLKVLVPLSITSPANKTIIVLENNTVELVCETTGSPPPNITWTKGYRVIGTGSPLRLAGVGRLNDGCYDCTADNGMGTSKNASVCLDVQYPADASLIASPSRSCVHGNVTLTCTAGRAKPPVTGFLYFLNGTRLGASNGSFTVNISGPGLHEFSCAAVNAVGAGEKGSSMIDVKAPTSILKLPLTITVVEGSNLTIPCDVTGSEPINVSWSRDNVAGFVGSRDLSFKPIDRLDEGVYVCTANNGLECPGTRRSTAVVVNYKPENTSLTSSSPTSCVNNHITFSCTATAKPDPHEYLIYKNGSLVASGNTTYGHVVRLPDAGAFNFTCVPNNTVGTGNVASVLVQVKEPPVITNVTANVTSHEGQTVTLECHVTGDVTNVTWSKGGQVISVGAVASFRTVRRSDAGLYWCRACGLDCGLTSQRSTLLEVKFPPDYTVLTASPPNVTYGDPVYLNCTATGNPAPQWYQFNRQGTPLENQTSGVYTSTAVSLGRNVYTCVPGNTLGLGVEANVTVFAKEKPPIYTNLAANPQTSCVDDVITLTCAVSPASNITSYAFYKNNTLLGTTSSRSYITTATSPGHVLFTCTPSISGDRHVLNGSAVVHVKAPPVVSLPVRNLTIREGENFNLGCSAHGSEPLDIRWLIAGANSTGNLTFTPIKQHQNGLYVCAASNGIECDIGRASVFIEVLFKPSILTLFSSLNGVAKATITCQASGNPRPSITWSGLDFIEDVIFVNKTSVLSRITVATLTARTFVCHARNALGDEKGYITLVTQDVAAAQTSAPGIGLITAGGIVGGMGLTIILLVTALLFVIRHIKTVESHNLQNIRTETQYHQRRRVMSLQPQVYRVSTRCN